LLLDFINMLKRNVLSFYLLNHFNTQNNTIIKQVENLIKKYFKELKYKISILNQWNTVFFITIKRNNLNKPYIKYINLLIAKL
jgi:hypothetical protein